VNRDAPQGRRVAPRAAAWIAWGRLLRVSLAPTAAADVAAGIVLANYGHWPAGADGALLIGASLCVYHAGMALNDWADRDFDRRARPERPIASGAVDAARALRVAVVLFAASIALAGCVSWRAAAWLAGLVSLVALYDLAGRGPLLGPALLAACRAANLSLGLLSSAVLAAQPLGIAPPNAWLLLALYAAYVFGASRVARLEDGRSDVAPGAEPRAWACLCAAVLLCVACTPIAAAGLATPDPAALVLTSAGAWSLLGAALRRRAWTRSDCASFTGMALRRLLVFTAAAVLTGRGDEATSWIAAAAILSGFLLSALLRRAFPPT
jgi:4-hydroxybenzoate polyprenyltransferase